MIVVDSSVWIAHLRDQDMACVEKLRAIDDPSRIIIGDIVLLEVLQGATNEAAAARIELLMRRFLHVSLLGDEMAVLAARYYRLLRAKGVTIRKTADLIIGTFCVREGIPLLHNDRDFDPMVEHLGLMVL